MPGFHRQEAQKPLHILHDNEESSRYVAPIHEPVSYQPIGAIKLFPAAGPQLAPMSGLSLGAPIPAILWSSLEDVLGTTMRLFAKDIAKTLGRPEAPLLQALKAETIRPYIFEESDDTKEIDMRCQIMCQKPDAPAFIQKCCEPVAWTSSSKRCLAHLSTKPPAPSSLPIMKRLEHEPPLYVSEDATVYSADGIATGQFLDGRLTLFCIEDDE